MEAELTSAGDGVEGVANEGVIPILHNDNKTYLWRQSLNNQFQLPICINNSQ